VEEYGTMFVPAFGHHISYQKTAKARLPRRSLYDVARDETGICSVEFEHLQAEGYHLANG